MDYLSGREKSSLFQSDQAVDILDDLPAVVVSSSLSPPSNQRRLIDTNESRLVYVRVTAWLTAEASSWSALPDAIVERFENDRRRLISSASVGAGAVLVSDGASLVEFLDSANPKFGSSPESPAELHCRWSHGDVDVDCTVPIATIAMSSTSPHRSGVVSVGLRIDYLCPLIIGGDYEDDEAWQRLDAGLVDYARQLGLSVAKWRRALDTNYYKLTEPLVRGRQRLIRVFYPIGAEADKLRQLRHSWHEQLGLAKTSPVFWPSMRLKFLSDPRDESNAPTEEDDNRIVVNPHLKAKPQPDTAPWVTRTVQGDYAYYHYGSCGFHDSGWGCAYRSLQTLVSWLRRRGVTDSPVPKHEAIQKALVNLGDKPKSLIGSRQWLGAVELSYALKSLTGVPARLVHVPRGSDLPEQARLLLHHFETIGSPVMIGGGQYAHTLLGCSLNEASGEVRWLVLDPHYTGSETDSKLLCKDGWCAWKPASFFKSDVHYNLCIPQPDVGV